MRGVGERAARAPGAGVHGGGEGERPGVPPGMPCGPSLVSMSR